MERRPALTLWLHDREEEAPVILRCLGSLRPLIDAGVVVDTASEDGTQDLVRAALAGLPGALAGRPWVDFATDRNEALARPRAGDTYRRDALTPERALLDAPEDARTVFYFAPSWRNAGEPELALRWYRRRAAMGGWAEEVWFSLYQIARILEGQPAVPWPEAAEAYLKAWDHTPDRAEPLYGLGLHHQHLRQFAVAHLYLQRAAAIPTPGPDRLFVAASLYAVHVPLDYAVSCDSVGDHAAAVAVDDRLLAGSALSPALRELVERNRGLSLEALGGGGGVGGGGELFLKRGALWMQRNPPTDLSACDSGWRELTLSGLAERPHPGHPLAIPRELHRVRQAVWRGRTRQGAGGQLGRL